MIFGKTSSISKNFESREFGRELTTNNSSAIENNRFPTLAKTKTTKQVPSSGPVSQRGEKPQSTVGLTTKQPSVVQQSQPLSRCRSIAEPFKSQRVQESAQESSLIKCMKIQSSNDTKKRDLSKESSADESSQLDSKRDISSVFKERMVNHRKKLSKKMVFADQLDLRDPQMVSEFACDIYLNMKRIERENAVDANYLTKVQLPTEVKDTSRAFLVEWIIDVHRKFRLLPETLYVTILLIDRFLSVKQIKKSQLHILGVTSLLISTKYEEIYPPNLDDLLSVSENKFSREEVLKMEMDMLITLQFSITTPSAYRFLERFRKLSTMANEDKIFFFAQYLQEIALLDASLLKYSPSEIAASALILSTKCLKRVNAWNKEMEKTTNYSEEYLAPIVEDVKSFIVEVNPKFLTTLKYKFSKTDYMEVASIAFKFSSEKPQQNDA